MASLFTPLLIASALILLSCGVGDQALQPETSNPPQAQSGERQEQRGAVSQAQDTLKATDEQKVARRTEDGRDAGVIAATSNGAGAQAPQTDPPQTSGDPQETFSQAELEQLVAPVALYPDSLLAYVLIASTYPQEVVAASRWVDQNKSLQSRELEAAAEEQRWDYSVKQLTATASVLAMMSDKLDWTEKLGEAVKAQQPDVMDAVQRLRAIAQSDGKLKKTDEHQVSRRTEDSKDVGTVAQAPQPDTSNPPPQTRSSERQESFSQAELEQLVAPIALYSDPLLARVLMASTYPLDVLEATRWVEHNKSLKGSELKVAAEKQNWDYSVKQLTATPSVLAMIAGKLEWAEKLGDAVLAQQPDLMDAVQRLRATAHMHGKLKTTDEQKVSLRREGSRDVAVIAATKTTDEQKGMRRREGSRDAIVIEATKSDTIYVPYYDPAVVYGEWPYPDHPPFHWPEYYYGPDPGTAGIVFAAFGVGAWVAHDHGWGGDFDWHRRHIHHRRGFNDSNWDATRWTQNPDHGGSVKYKNRVVAEKFDRNRGSRASRTISRKNERVADRDQRDRRGNVHNRGGSNTEAAAQKPALNKQAKNPDRSQKRLAQDRAPRRSDLRQARPRQIGMQADRGRASQMRMPADLDRRSFAADRSVESAMMRGFFGGGVQRAMRGFGGRRP